MPPFGSRWLSAGVAPLLRERLAAAATFKVRSSLDVTPIPVHPDTIAFKKPWHLYWVHRKLISGSSRPTFLLMLLSLYDPAPRALPGSPGPGLNHGRLRSSCRTSPELLPNCTTYTCFEHLCPATPPEALSASAEEPCLCPLLLGRGPKLRLSAFRGTLAEEEETARQISRCWFSCAGWPNEARDGTNASRTSTCLRGLLSAGSGSKPERDPVEAVERQVWQSSGEACRFRG
mmetsp:Transcript_53452/g.98871  ORF Transcript_53452/g.98871 Transcript_53452/m.98871 type:complete len:232 (+) Transcript_53452:1210-1905(+)